MHEPSVTFHPVRAALAAGESQDFHLLIRVTAPHLSMSKRRSHSTSPLPSTAVAACQASRSMVPAKPPRPS